MGEVQKLQVVKKDQAFRLQCLDDFDDNGTQRIVGDEWLFEGPKTYIPRKEVEIVSSIKAVTINPNEALKVKATRAMKDHNGKTRVAGEEWLIRQVGNYMASPYETIVETLQSSVMTDSKGIHMRALANYTDFKGKVSYLFILVKIILR